MSGEWNSTGVILSWLAYFTEHYVLRVHPRCSKCQNVLPFHGGVISHCLDISHPVYLIFHRWTCFHILATVTSAVANVCVLETMILESLNLPDMCLGCSGSPKRMWRLNSRALPFDYLLEAT